MVRLWAGDGGRRGKGWEGLVRENEDGERLGPQYLRESPGPLGPIAAGSMLGDGDKESRLYKRQSSLHLMLFSH